PGTRRDGPVTAVPPRHGPVRAAGAALALSLRAAPVSTVALVVLTALTAGLPAVSAWTGKLLFDELARGAGAEPYRVVLYAVVSAVGLALATVAASQAGYHSAVAHAKVTVEVDDRLVGAVSGLRGLAELEDPRFLDQLRLATQAAREAPVAVRGLIQELLRTVVTVAAFGGAMLMVWPPMMLVLLVSLVPALVSQRVLSRLRIRATEDTVSVQRRHAQYRFLATDLAAAKETRLFGLAGLFHNRMLEQLRAVTDVDLRTQGRVARTTTALAVLSAAVSAVAMVIAASRAMRGQLSIGDVTLFTVAVTATQSVVSSLLAELGRTTTALRLFGHYLSVVTVTDRLTVGSEPVAALRHGIELRDVWFRYDEDGPWVLRGVDLIVPHGQAVGLVGVNGAGKSTLVKLLCRFYEPQRGQILWDGRDIREFDIELLRRRIGVTFQDYMAYDLTAAENIGVGDVDRLDDLSAIRRSARLADMDDHLANLPRGYQTLLSQAFLDEQDATGNTLSGGQWQRVALARSVMRDHADLVILDEPSSGLDAEAEHQIHEALRAYRAGRTSLLISHRLSALRDADQIVVLREGAVVEQGPHDDLVATGGEYARLFSLQAKGYLTKEAVR
ncbi:MAG: ABC transporter ATP-binding protein, partial [Actinocatenispora sp.]